MKYTKEQLEKAIRQATSWAQVCEYFNVKKAGGTQAHIKSKAIQHHVDFSHFRGRKCSAEKISNQLKPAKAILITRFEGVRQRASQLRRALIESGVEHRCAECKRYEWMGQYLVLEIDHIDGDPLNDAKENLRFLCPNCHSLTPNYKNKKRPGRSDIGVLNRLENGGV